MEKQKTILLVEDDPPTRKAISICLSLENFRVLEAFNGIEGIKVLQNECPDLILADIKMPTMNGVEFYKELRKNNHWTKIPFIFLTANNLPDDIQFGKELGVEDYLTKPIDTERLLRIINARLLRSAQIEISLIGQAYFETVKVLANTIENRDPYTHGHAQRVVKIAFRFAQELGWSASMLKTLEFGGMLHDIGKITVPDHILKKQGPLTPDEWRLMKQHPIVGANIIKEIHLLQDALPYILYHHEKWDGTGYPKGLQAEQIPIEARLLSIVDVYDALTSTRPYRDALSIPEVIDFMKMNAGAHFDPKLVNVFLNIIRAGF